MRSKISKNIHSLVKDFEVVITDLSPSMNYTKRLKKNFWNKLNWKEKSKRTRIFYAKNWLNEIVKKSPLNHH